MSSNRRGDEEDFDFLAPTNHCGQTILKIVSRGNAIIAELLRLSNHIPSAFLLEDRKYEDIVFDFSYLKNPDKFDNKIASSADLLDFDEDFRSSHMPMLERFFLLFSNIYKYVIDVQTYFKNVEEGVVYLNHTIERCISNTDGIQLFAEAVYLYGVMLLLLDTEIPGDVRERMLMSYYRYKGAGDIENIDAICRLCQDTGFRLTPQYKVPKGYPVKYFRRVSFKESIIRDIINKLNNGDIYRQSRYYPSMEHRSTALSTQASMIYILLYFYPKALVKDSSLMRQIVDKHFPDNWVIPYYMGFSVDLSTRWSEFPAAKTAISNIVTIPLAKEKVQLHLGNLEGCLKKLELYLTEGQLTEEYVLDHLTPMLHCLRDCNVTLRWLILHRTCEIKKLAEITAVDPERILLLLLNTAQLEYLLKTMFKEMLEQKETKWIDAKTTAKDRIKELANYFSGTRALQKEKDEQLQAWFEDISQKIDDVDYKDSILAARKIQALITALIEVEEFHQIDQSLQVKQYLADTRSFLKRMIRLANFKEDILISVSTISDLSYAWEIINDYLQSIQNRIQKDPSLIIKMRSTFLKLASMLELPLVRIIEAKSSDVVSVSKYYSSELVAFVRRTLDIIPQSMFLKMKEIIEIQTNELVPLPDKFQKTQLKNYAQEDVRFKLARATFEVSRYTDGILAMKKTLMGVVEIDPKQLLEDGVRKELVRQIATCFEHCIVFKNTGRVEEFELQLRKLQKKLHGMLQSFQYIQDFIGIYGLKIWQEEYQRIINYNVEQESNLYLKRKVYDHQSLYQSTVIPIPRFRSQEPQTNTFMGRLVKELMHLTDPKRSVYVDRSSGWYDPSSGKEIVGLRTFELLYRSVGVFGLTGIDTIISFIIVRVLQNFSNYFMRLMDKKGGLKQILTQVRSQLLPLSSLPEIPIDKLIAPATGKSVSSVWSVFMDTVVRIGHLQLIRKHIATELTFRSKLEAEILWNSLATMNDSILTELKTYQKDVQRDGNSPLFAGQTPLLSELDQYMETIGIANPLEKIYLTSNPLKHLGLAMWLFVRNSSSRFTFETQSSCLLKSNKKDYVDGVPFVVGVLTALRQFHLSERLEFLQYLNQFSRQQLHGMLEIKKLSTYPWDLKFVIRFMQIYSRFGDLNASELNKLIPDFVFSEHLS